MGKSWKDSKGRGNKFDRYGGGKKSNKKNKFDVKPGKHKGQTFEDDELGA